MRYLVLIEVLLLDIRPDKRGLGLKCPKDRVIETREVVSGLFGDKRVAVGLVKGDDTQVLVTKATVDDLVKEGKLLDL